MRQIFLVLLILVSTALGAEPAAAKRVALVIGNGDYKAQRQLVNPPNDAKLVGDALAQAKFEIIDTKTNLGIAEFRQALRRFQAQANGADVALVYFAGHGIEANGANWLIPTDAELAEDRDLDYEAIKADLVLQALQGAKMRVLVLDACRDNPFGRSWRSGVRNTGSGLAKIEADDVLVLFAAAPGRTASDGNGATNSPFATALAKRLPEPGLSIQYLGGNVRDDVLASTGGNQRPYVSASITGKPFFLVPAAVAPAPTVATPSTSAASAKGLNAEEQKFFDSCVKLSPHVSRDAIVDRLAKLYRSGTHTYGWQYDPPASHLDVGDFPIMSAEALPNGVLVITYGYRWGRLLLTPVTLAASAGGATRGLAPRDTGQVGASIQLHGMWVQESGLGCAAFYMNGETGEASGEWPVTDDAGKLHKSVNRIKKVVAVAHTAGAAVPAKPTQADKAPAGAATPLQHGHVFRDCPECPEMVVVPAGSFMMGSQITERQRKDDESPVRELRVPQPLAVGLTSVTLAEFVAWPGHKQPNAGDGQCEIWSNQKLVASQTATVLEPGFVPAPQQPAVCVSWNAAQQYVRWLSTMTGQKYRLLTEAEREYIARAGTRTAFYWGNSISAENANYDSEHVYGTGKKVPLRDRLLPVRSFPANPWGIYEVHGSVHDWVQDCYAPYDAKKRDSSAVDWPGCSMRVIRGGTWLDEPHLLRSAARGSLPPNFRSALIGFRVARDLK